jgi:hypothetical protein
MTDTSGTVPTARPRATAPVSPTPASEGAPSNTVIMRHPETGGVTTAPRSAFEGAHRYSGWEEVDPEAEQESLISWARDLGVNVPDDSSGLNTVQAVAAYRRSNREV